MEILLNGLNVPSIPQSPARGSLIRLPPWKHLLRVATPGAARAMRDEQVRFANTVGAGTCLLKPAGQL